ncbi:MAG TPA: lysylphosphatidylglycerol synthase transmembrane domain-containing protein [Gemmatimonadaceae bacterium]|nr:lysylphosphatidylglycerol synthase transmembrane domain-containing protein [Gemmatimonadaceae bacterium]
MARRKGRFTVIAQWLLAAIVVGFAVRELARQWQGVAPALEGLRLDWLPVLASGALVIATYLLLIEAWRATLRVWSESLPFADAARIWFVSNLGKYVPGKVWQIAAMGALAQKRGVSATAAIGSSLLVNLVSVLAGFAVIAVTAAGRVGAVVGAQSTGGGERSAQLMVVGVAIAGAVALGLAPVAVPRLAVLAARMTGRPLAIPRVPPKAVWVAAGSTVASWLAYGVAFFLFARGITPRVTGNALSYIAVYTGSYLAGYLALFAPGGVGIREAAIVIAMPKFGLASAADAAVIAITSRLWLTILEILPGLLLFRSGSTQTARDQSAEEG